MGLPEIWAERYGPLIARNSFFQIPQMGIDYAEHKPGTCIVGFLLADLLKK
jgi:hypothetical protein